MRRHVLWRGPAKTAPPSEVARQSPASKRGHTKARQRHELPLQKGVNQEPRLQDVVWVS